MPRPLVVLVFVAGCATGQGLGPEHRTTGGPAPGHGRLPPGPWTVDSAAVTDSCGAGAGLRTTQTLQERGYRVVSTGARTRASIRCDWGSEDVPMWEVSTRRAHGECVAEGVRTLRLTFEVLGRPYEVDDEMQVAEVTFEGRARVEAEPPHRGCVVRREADTALLARALRSVGLQIPQGGQPPPPLVAPAPRSADVVEGEAGPGAAPASRKSIYPVDFGDRPAPPEAVDPSTGPGGTDASGSGPLPATMLRSGEDPEAPPVSVFVHRPEGEHPWERLEMSLEATQAGCTDFCSELFKMGSGVGLRLLLRVYDFVALDASWRWVSAKPRDGRPRPDDVRTGLTGFGAGARLYVGDAGSARLYGGLGGASVELGDHWESSGQTVGTRFSGWAGRLLLGVEVPALPWLRLGAHGRYDRVAWGTQCDRGRGCADLEASHPLQGSDVWSVAGEMTLGWP